MKDFYTKPIRLISRGSHNRFKAIMIVAFLLCIVVPLKAQDDGCYKKYHSKGVTAMDNKNYDKAIGYFETAKECADKPSSNDIDAKIKECKRLKNQAIQDKKEQEKRRKQEEEENRIREEQERQAQEREQAMARNAYMEITGIDFYNASFSGSILSRQNEALYVQDMQGLKAVINYDGLDEITRETTIYCKLIDPDGHTVTNSNSRGGFSWSQEVEVEPGIGNLLYLNPWSSTSFKKGTYHLEVYSEEKRIHSAQFYLIEKDPEIKTVSLTLRTNDDNASIYVNSVYKGRGNCSIELEPGTYTMECRRTNYRSSSKSVTVNMSMKGNTISLEAPTPITGNLHVESPKNETKVYLDGEDKGYAPRDFTGLLIGEHKVKFTKEKYYDDIQTINIKENTTHSLTANMRRIKHTPWIFSKPERFASVFVNPVYVFDYGLNFEDLGSVGGHFTYCRTHLGFFAQYAHGIETKNQSYSAGLVFRLTNRAVDLQLLGGVAYNRMVETFYDGSYYNSYTYTQNAWMGNAGIRIGWSSGSFSWWDLMGGVMFDGNRTIPYVGLGLGTTLTAGIIGAGIYGLQYLKK